MFLFFQAFYSSIREHELHGFYVETDGVAGASTTAADAPLNLISPPELLSLPWSQTEGIENALEHLVFPAFPDGGEKWGLYWIFFFLFCSAKSSHSICNKIREMVKKIMKVLLHTEETRSFSSEIWEKELKRNVTKFLDDKLRDQASVMLPSFLDTLRRYSGSRRIYIYIM